MPACITCKIGPQSLSLPAGLWIIDASVRGTREKAHRVGHSQRNELPGLGIEHFDGVGVHRSIHRCVFSQAEGIMQIHVSKVALVGMKDAVGVCRIVHSVQSPTLGTALPRGLRIFRALAHGSVHPRSIFPFPFVSIMPGHQPWEASALWVLSQVLMSTHAIPLPIPKYIKLSSPIWL